MDTPGIEGLTQEEKRVLEVFARGKSSQDMADELTISPDTLRIHVQSILTKLGVHSRLEAAAFAVKQGLVPPNGWWKGPGWQ